MLYELLVGALPFDPRTLRQAGLDAIRRQIARSTRPPEHARQHAGEARRRPRGIAARSRAGSRARSGRPGLDHDEALEKDRTRRYGSASELSTDVARYLSHRPVVAGPPSAAYRARKFVRRHRFGVAAASIALLALVGFAATMTVQASASRGNATGPTGADTARQVSDFLVPVQGRDPSEIRGNSIRRARSSKRSARIDRELKDQPLVQAQLMSTMGGLRAPGPVLQGPAAPGGRAGHPAEAPGRGEPRRGQQPACVADVLWARASTRRRGP